MPHKGLFTQGMAILLRKTPPLAAIEKRLADFPIVKRNEASGASPFGGGPSLLVAFRPDVNGYVLIELVDRRWPDQMGDPKTDADVFAAWGMGSFGPAAWPGGLERACQHAFFWPEAGSVVAQHQVFIRILCSYVLGEKGKGNASLRPVDYRPLPELEFVTRIAAALVGLPDALCCFNPNGECVQRASEFHDTLSHCASAKLMPLPLWSNVRLFTLSDMQPKWNFMDTVGMMQLDAPDHEACFELDAHDPGAVGNFLRNASAYVVHNGPIIHDGNTMDGAGIRWRAFSVKEGLVIPPRATIRWLPEDGRKVPERFFASIADAEQSRAARSHFSRHP